MKNEGDERYVIDLLIEALRNELEDMLLESMDNPTDWYNISDDNDIDENDELDFDIK